MSPIVTPLPGGERALMVMRVQQFQPNRFQDTIDVLGHIAVPETDDGLAVCLDHARPSGVLGSSLSMLSAIEFDDQTCAPASEIGNIRPDRILPCEFRPFDLASAQSLPQPRFHIRGVPSQFSRDRRQSIIRHSRKPSPNPLPQGEGYKAAA